jgi:hypothetical protein
LKVIDLEEDLVELKMLRVRAKRQHVKDMLTRDIESVNIELGELKPIEEVSDPYKFKVDEPVRNGKIVTGDVDQEKRYRHFIEILHKCGVDKNHAQSFEIEVIRSFFGNAEINDPFNNAEIDVCIDKMAFENKVMRSNDTVFII